MTAQQTNGKAFEWAIGQALVELTGYNIENSRFSATAAHAFQQISQAKKDLFYRAARRAIIHILERQPIASDQSSFGGKITFSSDATGQRGDVRDVLIHDARGVFGISCKTNHKALKHPRLSSSVDFVKKWGIHPEGCSDSYWAAVKPVFAMLAEKRRGSNGALAWEELENKADTVYWPILNAWETEINRVAALGAQEQSTLCEGIIRFIVGGNDFYKVICKSDGRLNVQAFNFGGTLPTRQAHYPTHLLSIASVNGGTYSKTLTFNRGLSINFRIHNASSKVEPSLKFDVNAIGLPEGAIHQQTFEPGDL
jgi:hypothetical protein